jgi:transposase InsO family protein
MRYAFIQEHAQDWPVELMCQVLEVGRSGYYDFCNRQPSPRQQWQLELKAQVRRVFEAHDGIYGSPRVHQALLQQGLHCNVKTVAKCLVQQHLAATQRRKFKVQTTDSDHPYPVAPNLLGQFFTAEAPNQIWTSDFTYIPTAEGWLYLAVVLDLYSRKVVGWSMNERMTTELPLGALEMALAARPPKPGLICHSDRGVQYASQAYRQRLADAKLLCSMSRKGNCYDNAVTESFFGSLKQELVYRREFPSRQEARNAIFQYIEIFYNRKRMHSTLEYLSPEAFEARRN